MTLRADYRMKNGRVLGEKRMAKIAKDLVNDDDDYTIVTRSGQRISKNEIMVQERVEIERHGKSVALNAAWQELDKFYTKLANAGVTSE